MSSNDYVQHGRGIGRGLGIGPGLIVGRTPLTDLGNGVFVVLGLGIS
jgi:hypothetical protein